MWEDLIKQFDKSNLEQVIADLPKQILKAWDFTDSRFNSEISQIFICGMGGSALPANILKTYLQNSEYDFLPQIHIIRNYGLPPSFNAQSGGIFVSYSGNTEETLNCLDQALQIKTDNIITISTNGKLQEKATELELPLVKIPTDVLAPRMAYGYFFGALLKILYNSELINASREALEKDVENLLELNEQAKKQAQTLAESLKDRIPLVYASDKWKYLAMIIKINFNENAKVQSFWNAFPELNHNEMVGFTKILGNYKALIFQDPGDYPKINQRMQLFQDLLGSTMPVEIIPMHDGSPVFKIFSTLMTGLWTSYYLALINGIDPTPVDMVENFKKKL